MGVLIEEGDTGILGDRVLGLSLGLGPMLLMFKL